MGDVLLDAFLDTLIILPFLLVMNFVIELVEYRSKGLKANRILKGGIAPLIGTAVGTLPQCGFSVVATELYGKRKIALGTLLGVYIATSDEALPIMLSSVDGLKKVLPVLIIKIVFSLVVGYSVFGIEKLIDRAKRENSQGIAESAAPDGSDDRDHEHDRDHDREAECDGHDRDHEHEHDDDEPICAHGCHHHALAETEDPLGENATKKQKAARMWHVYFEHPLVHTATVMLYILIVNIAFGIIVFYIGEDRLAAFMNSTGYLQPVLAGLIGLIPNCAASVVITELYVIGGLSLGGAVAGLCVSAGIGYAVLAKQNRPIKNTVLVMALMYVLSVALGVAVNGIMAIM